MATSLSRTRHPDLSVPSATATLMSLSMSASRLTMVILCMTMSKMRRSSDCHLRRAALLKVWLVPFLGNFFLQPEGRRGIWTDGHTVLESWDCPRKMSGIWLARNRGCICVVSTLPNFFISS